MYALGDLTVLSVCCMFVAIFQLWGSNDLSQVMQVQVFLLVYVRRILLDKRQAC